MHNNSDTPNTPATEVSASALVSDAQSLNVPVPPTPKSKWLRSSALALSLFILSFMSVLISIAMMISTELGTPRVSLILNRSGCSYLNFHHVVTVPYGTDGMCTAAVAFRKDWFDTGGTVSLPDRVLALRADQIYTSEILRNVPSSPNQQYSTLALIVSFSAVLGCVGWLFSLM